MPHEFAVFRRNRTAPLFGLPGIEEHLAPEFSLLEESTLGKLFKACHARRELAGCIWVADDRQAYSQSSGASALKGDLQVLLDFLRTDHSMSCIIISPDTEVQVTMQRGLAPHHCMVVSSVSSVSQLQRILGTAVSTRHSKLHVLENDSTSRVVEYARAIDVALQVRDMVTASHCRHTADLCTTLLALFLKRYGKRHFPGAEGATIASCFSLPVDLDLAWAMGMLHDCGKLYVDLKILGKRSKLSAAERLKMQLHVSHSAVIIGRDLLPELPVRNGSTPRVRDGNHWPTLPFAGSQVKTEQFLRERFFWLHAVVAHHYHGGYPVIIDEKRVEGILSLFGYAEGQPLATYLAELSRRTATDPLLYKTMVFINLLVLADGLNASVSARPYTKHMTKKFVSSFVDELREMTKRGQLLAPDIFELLLETLTAHPEIIELRSA